MVEKKKSKELKRVHIFVPKEFVLFYAYFCLDTTRTRMTKIKYIFYQLIL